MTFEESRLSFVFDDKQWTHVMKYDENTDFKKIQKAIDKTKAVDFIGILNNKQLVFIEVKNIRNYRIENREREFGTEVAQKIRDTLAGIAGGCRNSTNGRDSFREFIRILINEDVSVVLWLETSKNFRENAVFQKRKNAMKGTLTDKLQQKLSWLTSKAIVASTDKNPFDSLEVTFLKEEK